MRDTWLVRGPLRAPSRVDMHLDMCHGSLGDERITLISRTQAVALTDLQILTLAPLLLDLLAREEALQQLAPLLAGGELGGGLIERVLEGG